VIWPTCAPARAGQPLTILPLRPLPSRSHPPPMFVLTEADAAAIRAAFDRGGEFSAAVELWRLFPGVSDNAQGRECARTIAGLEAAASAAAP
jgi:hypothetical protein